jgi:hypothetical protein
MLTQDFAALHPGYCNYEAVIPGCAPLGAQARNLDLIATCGSQRFRVRPPLRDVRPGMMV